LEFEAVGENKRFIVPSVFTLRKRKVQTHLQSEADSDFSCLVETSKSYDCFLLGTL
jgi:hypothetical protein